ncbi:unnamed protein product [Sphagnum balticum]
MLGKVRVAVEEDMLPPWGCGPSDLPTPGVCVGPKLEPKVVNMSIGVEYLLGSDEGLLVALCRDGHWDLARLEIIVYGGEYCDHSHVGVGGIEGAVAGGNVHVEKAFGDSVEVDDRSWDVRGDLNDNLPPSENVGLGEVVLKEEYDFKWASLSNW